MPLHNPTSALIRECKFSFVIASGAKQSHGYSRDCFVATLLSMTPEFVDSSRPATQKVSLLILYSRIKDLACLLQNCLKQHIVLGDISAGV